MNRLSPLEAYRLWSKTWDAELSPIVVLEDRYLEPLVPDVEGKTVVDVACGTGRWLVRMAQRGARVFGVDFCLEMLACARGKPGLAGRLAAADARRLPFPDASADVVLFTLALGHIVPLREVIRELARLAKPGGRLLFSDFHPHAAAAGWRRTFRSNGRVYEIENHPYRTGRLLREARAAGLALERIIEPPFGEPERDLFRRVGRDDLFEQTRGVPAVLIAVWRRMP
ncbi:MAG TPA: class I SAM-dependent methyltransferase [Bryobacteraceae bacterium]|nr:class I SAM-dependent methyltransferase [Bryobacteraceae bacterium]